MKAKGFEIMQANPGKWARWAACKGQDQLFFSTKHEDREKAKTICNTVCLVREQCRAFALETHQQFGVWGGQSYEEEEAEKRREQARTLAIAEAKASYR